jgi:receptor protein-tyrosine kinase
MYQSRASLELQPLNDSFLDLRDVYPAASPAADAAVYAQTQAEILQQDKLLEDTARQLRLETLPEYRSPHGIVSRLRRDIRIVPVRNSRILQIVSEARSPQLAADLANTLAGNFIKQSVQARQDAARQTYQSLEPQLAELRRTLRLSPHDAKSALPAPGSAVDRRFYDSTLETAYRAWLAARVPSTNIRLVGSAEPPLTPSIPNWPLNLSIGLVGGLLLATACVMFQEQRKSVLRAPGDAATSLELPELGAIPQASSWVPRAIFSGSTNGRPKIEQAVMEERDGLSEAFRSAAASILTSGHNGSHPRVLVVTSCEPMEGKTTVVSNLGIALASISRKVLLIDGDMRHPRLHKIFDEANSWGLSDVLSEKNAIDELPLDVLAKKTAIPHLHLLPSGASAENVFGLLHSDRMARLLPLFRGEFDYVLVDAPPCLEFADARIMARHAEQLLLVVRANHTDRRAVRAAVQRLQADGIPRIGVILNRWAPGTSDPYYRTSRSHIRQGVS